MDDYKNKAQEFLETSHIYQLGCLPTEQPHPKTVKLSEWAEKDLEKGISVLKDVDLEALNKLLAKSHLIFELHNKIKSTLMTGGKIFLCGCGATGRLSLSLEYLWRERYHNSDAVVSFMAGGDIALVHSLEGFEDFPEYGAKHLKQLGFGSQDLLISTTEGGETPYVIGATEEAINISDQRPYFLYCNPDDILKSKVERSRRVIENEDITKINLFVGPMSLSGSTRMQASTVLMLSVGLALLEEFNEEEEVKTYISELIECYKNLNIQGLQNFIDLEANTYLSHDCVLYSVDELGLTVFTDTTERSPTFNLMAFEPFAEDSYHSLCYTFFEDCFSQKESWKRLLNRDPRQLNWLHIHEKTKDEWLKKYDFSQILKTVREKKTKSPHFIFKIKKTENGFYWQLDPFKKEFHLTVSDSLRTHIILKMILNTHSTLIMGRIGRYKNNIMTWVAPSNGKLIDRATRYVKILLDNEGEVSYTYPEIVTELFRFIDEQDPKESVVLKTFKSLKSK